MSGSRRPWSARSTCGRRGTSRVGPFGTKVGVTNRKNGKSVVVRINDRGPCVGQRGIDLSRGAAQAVSMTEAGIAPVKLGVLPSL